MHKLLVALAALLCVAAIACGGDDDDDGTTQVEVGTGTASVTPTPSPTVEPTLPALEPGDPVDLPTAAPTEVPVPSVAPNPPGTVLSPATYRTTTFTPAVTFTIADGWSITGETERSVTLIRRPEPDNTVLTFDTANQEPLDTAVSRYSTITGTTASNVTDTTVGGYPAKEFDVTNDVIITPINNLDQPYTILENDKLHFWVVDVNGVTVKIIAESRERDFESYLALARLTVDTVEFE